jgi:CRP/FNR family transcriptional regulator
MAISATWSLNTTGFLELQWRISGRDLTALCQAATEHAFAPGTVIVAQGDMDETMYLILEGWVRIVRAVPDQGQQDLARLGSCFSFGEMAFLTGCPRTASAIAETAVHALSFTRSRLKALWTTDAPTALNFYQTLTHAMTHSLVQFDPSVERLA